MDQLDRDWLEFGERHIGETIPEVVDNEYVDGVTNGQKCTCGEDIHIDTCPECGITIVGCLSCHLDVHEAHRGAPSMVLGYYGRRHLSDLQHHRSLHD